MLTSVHALAMPASRRSSHHSGSDCVTPTAAVTTTVDTNPIRISAVGVTCRRDTVSAPTR